MFGFGRKKTANVPSLTATALSDTGLVRPNNEDNFHVDVSRGVFCVADGMGGGAEGEKASAIVCREIRMMMNVVESDYATRVKAVQRSLVDANAAIHSYAQSKGFREMGSTAAALVFDLADAARATVLHVGDSRVYRLRGGLAVPLTRDHSVGVELSDFAGRQAEALRDRSNRLAHILTRAVGAQPTVEVASCEIEVRPGDRFVLCTDGVHDVITDARLAVFAGGGTLDSAKARLAEAVRAKGAPDNYTFILVQS